MSLRLFIAKLLKHKKNPPRQYISPYHLRGADGQHLMVMRARLARNPQEAQRLMERWQTDSARELIALVPVRRPTVYERLKPTLAAMLGETLTERKYFRQDNELV